MLWLERAEERDALDEWLVSDLVFEPVNREKQALMHALRLVS